jgi:hypothetical protein
VSAPEFTAYEINAFNRAMSGMREGHTLDYWRKCKEFLDEYESDHVLWHQMSPKQQDWLWGIKTMLQDFMD